MTAWTGAKAYVTSCGLSCMQPEKHPRNSLAKAPEARLAEEGGVFEMFDLLLNGLFDKSKTHLEKMCLKQSIHIKVLGKVYHKNQIDSNSILFELLSYHGFKDLQCIYFLLPRLKCN